jgi:hypothetical protein
MTARNTVFDDGHTKHIVTHITENNAFDMTAHAGSVFPAINADIESPFLASIRVNVASAAFAGKSTEVPGIQGV